MNLESLTLAVTAQCNLRCSYCYQNAKAQHRMAWETLRKALDLALQSTESSPQVVFSGGEPLLEFPLIREAVRYVEEKSPADKNLRFGVGTNGILLDEQAVEYLAAHDFETRLSFDGTAQAQEFRGKGTFDVLDRLIDHLRSAHPAFFGSKFRVNMTLLPETVACLSDSIRYFLEKGVRELVVYPAALPDSAWYHRQTEDLEDQFTRVFEACLRHFWTTKHMPLLLFRKEPEEFLHWTGTRLMCGALSGRLITVDVDGSAYGCALAAKSYQQVHSPMLLSQLEMLRIGDITDPAFARNRACFAAHGPRDAPLYRKETKYSSIGRCSECRYFDQCEVCSLSIGADPANRDPDRVPDFHCAFNKVALGCRDKFPARPGALDLMLAAGEIRLDR